MNRLVLFLIFFMSCYAFAGSIKGLVTAASDDSPLAGANVFIEGTTIGAAANEDGLYVIDNVDNGKYTLVCSYVSYATEKVEITVDGDVEQNFQMVEYLFSKTISVIADRAKERETPVAFTNVSKQQMARELGSQDIPLILNTTPSVFATVTGGGAGDARVNVRGFNQRNTAIMINGVPVNDMENGWVYWSNWDGIGDATSSIQVQRGLSAVNLATPSIGGTMNILTDPSSLTSGVSYKHETGSGNFNKETISANSGLIDDKFAVSFSLVRKTGDGVIDGAWTDAWAYYMGTSYQLDKDNRFEFYAMGAPQRHGQRRWKLNAATFSHELAKDLGYTKEMLQNPLFAEKGTRYNSNWNSVSTSYNGKQYWNTDRESRYANSFINESENYFHKPLVNFNWYTQLTQDLSLYTTVYWSGGEGGGTGTFGSLQYDYALRQRVVDFDATINRNLGNEVDLDLEGTGDTLTYRVATDRRDGSFPRSGILRNSVNNQSTIGAISKAYYKISNELTTSFGIDWRTAEIEHYREVRDLLGLDYYNFDGNEFDSARDQFKGLGDKIDYNFTNNVNWLGGYAQGEYNTTDYTIFGMAGVSMIKYDHTNHFMKDTDGSEVSIETDNIYGGQVKGGMSYRLDNNTDVYTNLGYISKVPLLDAVINDYRSELIDDYENEEFYSAEIGSNIKLLDNTLSLSGNAYYTIWNNRTLTQTDFDNAEGVEGLVVVTGLDAEHMGIEFTGAYQPVTYGRIDAALSVGKWENTSDSDANYKPYSASANDSTFTAYTKGIKVGDAPQTQIAVGLSVFPIEGMTAQLVFRHYENYYSDWNALTRTDASDRGQSWKIPDYSLVDFHFSYKIPLKIEDIDVRIYAHVFNLLDELYVMDALDNSPYNSYNANGVNHKADDAEIYPGLPRTFNLGFQVSL